MDKDDSSGHSRYYDPFFSELAKEVENSASDNNYYVVLVNTEFSEERECEYLIRLLTKKIDGIILVPSGSVVRQEHLLPQKYNIPLCCLTASSAESTALSAYIQDANTQPSNPAS